jgi:site-specific recombinase XerD
MIKFNTYLDFRGRSEDDFGTIKITVSRNGSTAYIPTPIRLKKRNWNPRTHLVGNIEDRDKINALILREQTKVTDAYLILNSDNSLSAISALKVKDKIVDYLYPKDKRKGTFIRIFDTFARSRPKVRTTQIYMETIKKIMQFNSNYRSLTFDDITLKWLEDFESFLAQTSSARNARNIHLRNIRAVFNYAIDNDITNKYPFRKFKIKSEQTRKRALSVCQLRQLRDAELKPFERKYIDFFMLSFLLIGMNTEDLLHVKKISSGRIEYSRAKTDKLLSIKVEPEAMKIIDKYRGKKFLLNILDTYECTHNWTSKVDMNLKAISKRCGLPEITMYWARHTWATIAAELDVPKETISQALGHSGNTVTDIYIKFDSRKIDEANRKVIDYVMYEKRPKTVIEEINEKIDQLLAR